MFRNHYTYALTLILAGSLLLAPPSLSQASTQTIGDCDLPIDVRATLVADDVPEWSIAMLYNRDNKHNGSFSINKGKNVVMPGVILVEITSLSVVLKTRSGLQRCMAKGHRFKGNPTPAVAEKPVAKPRGRDEPTQTEVSSEAKAILTQFSRLTHDKKSSNGKPGEESPGMWSEYAAGMLGKKAGEGGHGFRLEKIKRDSLLYEMGLRNFDVVKTVNGKNFDDPGKAMDLLEGLGNEDALTVVVRRRGKDVKIDVQLD